MPNIRGFNDYRNENDNRNNNNQDQNNINQQLLDYFGANNKNIQKENYFTMIKNNFCSNLTWKSISVILSIIFLIMFIIEIIFDGIILKSHFLQIKENKYILNYLGLKKNDLMYGTRIYKLITNIFVFNNFYEIANDLFAILLFGSIVELFLTNLTYILIIILSRIASVYLLFTIKNITNINGFDFMCLLGGLTGFLILKWKSLKEFKTFRTMLVISLVIIIILLILFNSQIVVSLINYLIGIILGMFLCDNKRNKLKLVLNERSKKIKKYKRTVKLVGLTSYIILLGVCIPVFYSKNS